MLIEVSLSESAVLFLATHISQLQGNFALIYISFFAIFASVFTVMRGFYSHIKAVGSPSRYLYTWVKYLLSLFVSRLNRSSCFSLSSYYRWSSLLIVISKDYYLCGPSLDCLQSMSWTGKTRTENCTPKVFQKSWTEEGSPSSACKKHFSLCSPGGCWPADIQSQTFNCPPGSLGLFFQSPYQMLLSQDILDISFCWSLWDSPLPVEIPLNGSTMIWSNQHSYFCFS